MFLLALRRQRAFRSTTLGFVLGLGVAVFPFAFFLLVIFALFVFLVARLIIRLQAVSSHRALQNAGTKLTELLQGFSSESSLW